MYRATGELFELFAHPAVFLWMQWAGMKWVPGAGRTVRASIRCALRFLDMCARKAERCEREFMRKLEAERQDDKQEHEQQHHLEPSCLVEAFCAERLRLQRAEDPAAENYTSWQIANLTQEMWSAGFVSFSFLGPKQRFF